LDHSLPIHSGYAYRSQSLFVAQKKRGWYPLVVTSSKHYASAENEWTECEQIEDILYHRAEKIANSIVPLGSEIRTMLVLAMRIASIAKREHPDLLHAHSPILNAIPALWVSRRARIPMIYEMRALWEDAAVDHGTYKRRSWQYRLVKWLETWVCRKAAHVTVISDGLRSDLLDRGIPADKITIIPNGVDLGKFSARKSDLVRLDRWNFKNKMVIGFIGSFFRYEGLDLLIEAFARLVRTRSDIGLLLVGDGEMKSELLNRIKQLHLEELVAIPGSVPSTVIPEIYGLIDVLVYPRHSMRLTELVTPLKPLEAMAMGKPLIASDVGGHRELIQNYRTGLLFKAGSVSALVGAVERLLDSADLRRELGERALWWVSQNRSWETTTSGYMRAYTKALKAA
jgi:PEP-CTERM/exosortase A-associated glycosyltransferase